MGQVAEPHMHALRAGPGGHAADEQHEGGYMAAFTREGVSAGDSELRDGAFKAPPGP